jgi:hypothetical protein
VPDPPPPPAFLEIINTAADLVANPRSARAEQIEGALGMNMLGSAHALLLGLRIVSP